MNSNNNSICQCRKRDCVYLTQCEIETLILLVILLWTWTIFEAELVNSKNIHAKKLSIGAMSVPSGLKEPSP